MNENKPAPIKRRTFLDAVSKAGLMICLPAAPLQAAHAELNSPSLQTNQFITGPYLQQPSDTGITIMWITSSPAVSWVELIRPGQEPQKFFTEQHGLVQANNRINKIRIDGLTPGTAYEYVVYSREILNFKPYEISYGETIKRGPFSFSTTSMNAKEVSIVVFNDLHDHPENITELMAKFCKEPDYDLVVFNGDAFNWVDDEAQIVKDLLAPAEAVFAARVPFLMVQGNHEVRGKFARQMFDYFDYPGQSCYYAFTRGPVRFVVLDSGEDKDDDHKEYSGLVSFNRYREEQAVWLAQEIESKAFKKAAFRVVLIHIPVFHSGEGHGTLHCRKLFNPLFNKGKIDLAISGHTHRYGTFDADPQTHNYPIVIGGGPGHSGRGGGPRTLIKMKASEKSLSLQMLIDDGTVVGSYSLKK